MNVNIEKLNEYLEKTNQIGLKFIKSFKNSNWKIPEKIIKEYQSMYLKDNDFIVPKDKMEIFAQTCYLSSIISHNYKFPFKFDAFYKWFKACHSVSGTYDVYVELTPIA